MEYKYKITFGGQLRQLKPLLITLAMFTVACVCIWIYSTIQASFILLYGFIFMFITAILPVAIVHIQYFIKNRLALLDINTLRKTIIYDSPSGVLKHQFV